MRKHRAFLKSRAYTIELIDSIEAKMIEYNITPAEVVQMMFKYASNDFLESIRDRLEMESIRLRYMRRIGGSTEG